MNTPSFKKFHTKAVECFQILFVTLCYSVASLAWPSFMDVERLQLRNVKLSFVAYILASVIRFIISTSQRTFVQDCSMCLWISWYLITSSAPDSAFAVFADQWARYLLAGEFMAVFFNSIIRTLSVNVDIGYSIMQWSCGGCATWAILKIVRLIDSYRDLESKSSSRDLPSFWPILAH